MKMNFANSLLENQIKGTQYENLTTEEVIEKGYGNTFKKQIQLDVPVFMNKLDKTINDDTKGVNDVNKVVSDMSNSPCKKACTYLVWKQFKNVFDGINSTIDETNKKYNNAISSLMKEYAKIPVEKSNKSPVEILYKKEPSSISNKNNLISGISKESIKK